MTLDYMLKALKARKQNRQSRHFEKTSYGRALARFKDIHKGEICVITGNGPSLNARDLQLLHEKGVVTFASNRVYNIFEQTDWRPTYYVSEDVNVLRGIQDKAAAVPAKAKFMPINLKWYENVDIPGANYFYMDYSQGDPETFGISLDVPHSIVCRSTVTTTCMQLAIYMGFSEIYLIGVDHSFAKMVDKDGNVIIDNSIRSHFVDNYNSDIEDLGYNIDATTQAYLNVEQLSRKLGSFRIFNATRGGKLEVYERVDFDKVFQED